MHAGDFSAIVAVLGLVSIQIGSQDLLFLFGVLAPASMFIDVFWMVGRPNNYVRGHGWLIFFTVCDMLAKVGLLNTHARVSLQQQAFRAYAVQGSRAYI